MTNEQIIERLNKAELEYMGHTEQGELVAKALPAQWSALLAPADTVTISRETAQNLLRFVDSVYNFSVVDDAEAGSPLFGTMDYYGMEDLMKALRQALNPTAYIGTDSAGNARVARTDGGTAAETSPLQYICPMCGSPDPHHSTTTCEGAGDGE